jgi:hypothetical protein
MSYNIKFVSNSKECIEQTKNLIIDKVESLKQAIEELDRADKLRVEFEFSIAKANDMLHCWELYGLTPEKSEEKQQEEKKRGRPKKQLFVIPKEHTMS